MYFSTPKTRISNPGISRAQWLGSNNRNQPALSSTDSVLVKIQVLGDPKRGVEPHNHNRNDQRHQHIQPHARENQRHDGDQAQREEHGPVVEAPIEENDGAGDSEEVKAGPGEEDDQEDDHRHRVPQEAEEDDQKHRHGVVHSEVADVVLQPARGVGVVVRDGEGGRGEELAPWAARGVHGSGGARGRGGLGSLGIGAIGGGGGAVIRGWL